MEAFDAGESAVRLTVFGKTDPGAARSENQDSFLVADLGAGAGGYRLDSKELAPASGAASSEVGLGPFGFLLLVADGMGGAAAGGVASELAASYVYEYLLRSWVAGADHTPERYASCLREAVEWANVCVYERSREHPALQGMGTTVTAVGVLGDHMYIAQVGDSRAYVVRNGVAVQLTQDQSVVQQMVHAGLMTEEEAEVSHQRNVILQAVGISPSVQVELTFHELRRGDTALVCSDGVSSLLRKEELAAVLDRSPDPAAACEEVTGLAHQRGAPDNITFLCARFDGASLHEPSPSDLVERRVYSGS